MHADPYILEWKGGREMSAKRLSLALSCIIATVLLAAGCGGGGEQPGQATQLDTGGKPDFRNARWGMTREQVESVETAPADTANTDETRLLFKDKMLDLFDCSLFYIFSDEGLLVAAGYEMDASNTNFCGEGSQLSEEDAQLANRMKAVDFYHEVTQNLVGQYGQPSEDKANWYSDHSEAECNYDAKIGYARDAVFFTTKWALGGTLISQEMTKGKFKVSFIKR
jgi:hypothetical protein